MVARRWAVVAVVVSCALSGSSTAAASLPPIPPPVPPSDAVANEPAAKADALARLASVPLPAGASPSAQGVTLEVDPGLNIIAARASWIVSSPLAAVEQYIVSHPPAGSRPFGTGLAFGPGLYSVSDMYAWPIDAVFRHRLLNIDVSQLTPTATGVYADAATTWMTRRPAAERIPPGARVLRVTEDSLRIVDRAVTHPARRITVGSSKTINRVVALINALPASQPFFCPGCGGWAPVPAPAPGVRYHAFVDVRLAFYAGRAVRPFAVAVLGGQAGGLELTLRGHLQPLLQAGQSYEPGTPPTPSLLGQLESLLGFKA